MTHHQNTNTLKPCPACGCRTVSFNYQMPNKWVVSCRQCWTNGPTKDGQHSASEAWNALPRHNPQEDQALKREVYRFICDSLSFVREADVDAVRLYRERLEAAGWHQEPNHRDDSRETEE